MGSGNVTALDANPLLLAVQRARDEADQRRILERALDEASVFDQAPKTYTTPDGFDSVRMRNVPITAIGVAAVQAGTQPLQALLAKERRTERKAKHDD